MAGSGTTPWKARSKVAAVTPAASASTLSRLTQASKGGVAGLVGAAVPPLGVVIPVVPALGAVCSGAVAGAVACGGGERSAPVDWQAASSRTISDKARERKGTALPLRGASPGDIPPII